MSDFLDEHIDAIFQNPVFDRYLERLADLYFHGIPLYYAILSDFFRQFGHSHLKHGLCFQTAALAMLIYKDNSSATLVQGMASPPSKDYRTSHSWIEFYEMGCRWILDITWNFPVPVPISVGEEQLGDSEIYRAWTCTHDDFWSSKISTQLYGAIGHSETSYILNLLNIFVPAFSSDEEKDIDAWGFKCGGNKSIGFDTFNYFEAELQDGISGREAATFFDPGGEPITQGIINAYMKKPNRGQLPQKVLHREEKVFLRYLEERFC